MKKSRYILLLVNVFISILLNGCCSHKNVTNYKRQWMLVTFKDYTKEFLTEKRATLNLSPMEGKDNSESGIAYMGCNNMRLKAKFSNDGKTTFSDLISTRMFCPGNLESDFSTAIVKITHSKIEGHFLYLYNEKEQQMKFIAADWD